MFCRNKIGLKIWSTNTESFFKLAEFYKMGIIDYVELYLFPNSFNYDNLEILRNIPLLFHAPDFVNGFNVRFRNCTFDNVIDTIDEFIDFFGNKEIIFHPGYDSKECITSRETLESFNILTDNGYDLIVENMPKVGLGSKNIFFYGTNKTEIQEIISEINCKFCLDFGHAVCSSNYHNGNYLEFIDELLELKPHMFHISDGYSSSLEDNHLSFGEGDFPIFEMLNRVKNKFITLETPKKNDFINLSEDLKNLNLIHNKY